ncbi:hypothetical protein ACJJTC_014496 [Scirpophaga incertulas]
MDFSRSFLKDPPMREYKNQRPYLRSCTGPHVAEHTASSRNTQRKHRNMFTSKAKQIAKALSPYKKTFSIFLKTLHLVSRAEIPAKMPPEIRYQGRINPEELGLVVRSAAIIGPHGTLISLATYAPLVRFYLKSLILLCSLHPC